MNPPLLGLAPLARMAFRQEPLTGITESLLARLAADENDAAALLDFATLLYLSNQAALAEAMQKEALATRRIFTIENTLGLPADETLQVLAFLIPGDLTRNTAIEFLTEGTPVTLHLAYLQAGEALPEDLPEHDIAFVAVCESTANRPTLLHLETLLANWPRPLINAPRVIANMTRDTSSQQLQGIAGLHCPPTLQADRDFLNRIAAGQPLAGLPWPLIIRPLDSHKGQGLAQLASPAELALYLQSSTENAFFLAPFVDYRSTDGLYRKYRIVLIEGQPYICHLCMADKWMLHYMSAGMNDDTEAGQRKRDEEAEVFAQFDAPNGFATRHQAAFAGIYQRLGLPYIGLDCGETRQGDLLIFEIDVGMTVHAMDPEDRYPYKAPHMRKVFDAFYAMLVSQTQSA